MTQTNLSRKHSLSVQQTFSALRHRDYRLWFFGQMTSLFGTWMQSTAQGYLVFQLTQSTAYLGYVSSAAGLPAWLLTLFCPAHWRRPTLAARKQSVRSVSEIR